MYKEDGTSGNFETNAREGAINQVVIKVGKTSSAVLRKSKVRL